MKFLSLSLFSAMISITFEKGMNEYLLVKINGSQDKNQSIVVIISNQILILIFHRLGSSCRNMGMRRT